MTLALVCWSAVVGCALGLAIQPAVDRVVAARSDSGSNEALTRLLEPLMAGVFAVTAWQIGWSVMLLPYLALAAFLVALSVIDLATKTLPRRIVWSAGAVGVGLLTVVAVTAGEPERLIWAAIGAAAAFLVFTVLHVVGRGAFGFGDVRLGVVLGWYLGWLGLSTLMPAMLIAFGLSAVTGLVLMIAGRAGRRTEIPFGPFLAASALVVVLAASSLGGTLPV